MIHTFVVIALFSLIAKAVDLPKAAPASVVNPSDTQRTLDSLTQEIKRENATVSRTLSSGDSEEDIGHYKLMSRRIGIDIGVMSPTGDFSKEFNSAPMIGVHFTWEAIRPLNLTVSSGFSSASRKTGAQDGRLTVYSLAMGANALMEMGRAVPYLRLEATFDSNNVSMGTTYVTSGGDGNITTIGANIGFGVDFIVGREVSFGLQAYYHYSVPNKVTLNTTQSFDLGSNYIITGLRLNF